MASNGFNLIGSGTESTTMGGADLAVARDTSALNTNPAGLVQLPGRRLDLHSAVGFLLDVGHEDSFGNQVETADRRVFIGNIGYASGITTDVTAGFGLFAQAGSGMNYRGLTTAFGTQDDLSLLFGVVKLTTGAAYRVNPQLSLGASVALVYAQSDQKVFPETSFDNPSDPAQSFFGFEVRDATATAPGFKLGLQYRPTPAVTLGLAYTHQTALELEGKRFVANYSALGLGKVTYGEVVLRGVGLPKELGAGVAFRPSERWLIAMDITWIDWSKAVHEATLTATNPDNPAAPTRVELNAIHHWRDQYVVALGFAYEPDARSIYRFGYNYGRNPIPAENLTPLLPMIVERHVTFGAGYRLGPQWRFDGGIEYYLPIEVSYTNPRLPFGENARERGGSFVSMHLTLSRIW
jgi:long-chain fatty acid transport protein